MYPSSLLLGPRIAATDSVALRCPLLPAPRAAQTPITWIEDRDLEALDIEHFAPLLDPLLLDPLLLGPLLLDPLLPDPLLLDPLQLDQSQVAHVSSTRSRREHFLTIDVSKRA